MATKKRPARSRPRRWSVDKKTEVVMRLLRGESLDALARETGQPAARLSEWRELFISTGKAGLKSHVRDAVAEAAEDERRRLLAKVGELSLENEILREGQKILEGRSGPFAQQRRKRLRRS
jgi:transposase-like protein